ncbi:LysR family transcriptional regulator [Nocardioides sp. Root190]|uniref:LysR substrate-binding domain-containing protein n=1 Tax=Nocardioides sp. Root190 TaxID=1736488 RepID=UPI0006FABB22|nr:LysR substrate-binding domain-containing protein [Nocardioides sp. Root190]KRB75098.1 LysR family transcriptional regulator [Nocardioides sp. Root190]
MELRHLRYFSAVAETRHFGRAAERLHMAQPALSQSIRQLEAELGTPLFVRTTRQVRLTPAGEFLQAEATRILAAVEDSARGVRRIAEGRQGLVRIAFTGSAAHTQLPRVARVIKRVLPRLALEIHADLLTPAQVDGLIDGSLDLGVLRPPMATREGLRLRTIASEPLVLAVAADHRLATEPVISMTDLRTEPFVLFAGNSSAVNEAVLRSCHEAGFVPHREHEAAGISVQLPLVAAGLGIALVPGSVRAAPLAGVAFRDVTDAATVDLALAWRADESNPAVLAILDALDAPGVFSASPVPTPSEVNR